MKKINILIPDLLKDTFLEKKILGKKYDIFLRKASEFNKLTDKFLSKIDGVMTGHHVIFDKKKIEKLINCKVIVRYGVGFDSVDIKQAGYQNIKVFNIPDYGVDEVADHALAMILNLSRFINGNDEILKKEYKENEIKWLYDQNKNQKRLKDLSLGIIGLGRIGTALAERSKSIFKNILFYDPLKEDGYDKALGIKKEEKLINLFKNSDVISLHAPSTEKNKFFLEEKLFKILNKPIIFVNTSRGDLVKNSILAKYFKSGKIRGLGLDVFNKEPPQKKDALTKIWEDKQNIGRIIFTPHVAFYSTEALNEIRFKGVTTIKKFFENKKIKNCINTKYL